jgi:hypothetical protein
MISNQEPQYADCKADRTQKIEKTLLTQLLFLSLKKSSTFSLELNEFDYTNSQTFSTEIPFHYNLKKTNTLNLAFPKNGLFRKKNSQLTQG